MNDDLQYPAPEAIDLSEVRLRAMMRQAAMVRADIDAFEARFPPIEGPQTPMPKVTWEGLERQLMALSPARYQEMVRIWLSGVRKVAHVKPPELVLRELICLVGILEMDRLPLSGEDSMP